MSIEDIAGVLRVLVGLGLLTASGFKIRDMATLRTVTFLLAGPFRTFYKPISMFMVGVEAVIGGCLCCGLAPVITAVALVVLMMLFDYVVSRLYFGDYGVNCGCFGSSRDGRITGGTLLRNAFLTLVASVLLWLSLSTTSGWWLRPSLRQATIGLLLFAIVILGARMRRAHARPA